MIIHVGVQPHRVNEFKIQTHRDDKRKSNHRLARLDGFSEQARHNGDCMHECCNPLVTKRKRPSRFLSMAFIYAGNYLLSHTLSRAVPSAQRGLTSVFGMGTGGTPAVRSPTTWSRQPSAVSHQQICAVATYSADG